ncbi:MAG: FAD-binding oxidoreductase [Meiothermus sp.]|nr:FAD-binding oxidoreductase [Meiothermus sp.]
MADQKAEVLICGAGIAGIAAAYHLSLRGVREVVLLETGDPLSLTSDKSTEAYRNWWPGDPAMIGLMNRSIDLLEGIAGASRNRINLNRRGYLYATADPHNIATLEEAAASAAEMGAGEVRRHTAGSSRYQPSPVTGFDIGLEGADLLTDPALIRRHFPHLSPATVAAVHVRRAGWLGAQQLGMWMLEQARAAGVRLVRGQLTGLQTKAGRFASAHVRRPDGSSLEVHSPVFVNAAGPMLQAVGEMLGLELPVFAERHLKMSFGEHLGVVPRESPMLIWMDPQRLPWSEDERQMLAEDEATRWLLEPFPSGVHCRPDGHGDSTTLIALFNYHVEPVPPTFPLPQDPHYAEITLRGLSTMLPGLQPYLLKTPKPWIDGGYYLKTRENRPLIGPLPVPGAYVIGAMSGFGIMASSAAGELLAAHVLGGDLPAYAPAFRLERYQDPEYVKQLETWGDGAQL